MSTIVRPQRSIAGDARYMGDRGAKSAPPLNAGTTHTRFPSEPSGLPEKVLVEKFPGGPVEEAAVDWVVPFSEKLDAEKSWG